MRKIFVFLLGLIFIVSSNAATLIHDTETQRLLSELVSPLATAADISPTRLNIHIVDDDDFNAFVAGGEDVYIYTGLLKQIRNPDALQAVVAHELGHTIGGHMAQMSERMASEMRRTMLIQALGVGLMVAGGNPSLGAGVLAGASGVAQQSMLAFTRDEERIADNLGVDLMVRSGQNPNGFVDVFEQMSEISGAAETRINPNYVNHPLTAERLNNVRTRIAQTASDFVPDSVLTKKRSAEYEMVRAKLVGYLDTPLRVRELYPVSDKSDAAIYARAIANMRNGNLEGARTGTQTLISRKPNNPYFYELLGDIEYQSGDYAASIAAYDRSLSLIEKAPQIQAALALVLTERGGVDDRLRAIDLCKRSLLSEPAPLTYWVLARAYGVSDSGRHDWALAEYYNMINKTSDAIKYAKSAMKHLEHSDPEYIKSADILVISDDKK